MILLCYITCYIIRGGGGALAAIFFRSEHEALRSSLSRSLALSLSLSFSLSLSGGMSDRGKVCLPCSVQNTQSSASLMVSLVAARNTSRTIFLSTWIGPMCG